jgi:hypothetical protein
MNYRGMVRNGVVVFEGGKHPRDGAIVEVRLATTPAARAATLPKGAKTTAEPGPERGSPAAVLRHRGTWRGGTGEMDRLLTELQNSKRVEAERDRARLLPQPSDKPPRLSAPTTADSRRRRAS